ncbi:MAG TPA: hypothetical protein VLA91_15010 [Acidimicrobiia bacterium]|nr:hypothetical protein [Acidimicrobiia bacterium]
MTIDERIASELRSHAPQVDEHMAWDRIQSAAAMRGRRRALRLVPISVAVLGFALVGLILVSTFPSGPEPASDPRSRFVGTWVTIDLDGSTPTMVIQVSGDEDVEMLVHDDFASVCSGAPSTMEGTGRLESSTELVIPSPVLTCDDGSQPEALSGPPLAEQLQNLTFVHDPDTDALTENLGSVWTRESADPSPGPTTPTGMWPQSSLEEVREAQLLADAGDPDYTWQVDPELAAWAKEAGDAEIVTRFLRDELGWEEFQNGGHGDASEETSEGLMWATEGVYIRCAPDLTNPLYPDDPVGGRCAPTIDEHRYEKVSIRVAQLGLQGPSGLWVVTRWVMLPPSEQVAPPSEAEATTPLQAFLQARIDGEGAERHLGPWDVPLLYATTTGAPYERSEIELLEGPVWPLGHMEFKVRLFAEGGETVVEQFIQVRRDTGRLMIVYSSEPGSSQAVTIENGQAVPVPYSFLDGEVTFGVAHPWDAYIPIGPGDPNETILALEYNFDERVVVVADPRPIETGCQEGTAPASAEALARSILSDPDLEASAPLAASVGGTHALQMDVVAAPGASLCEGWMPFVVTGSGIEPGSRMRLYLLDLPGSARILAIAIIAPEDRFESVLRAAAPILDSLEFHTG